MDPEKAVKPVGSSSKLIGGDDAGLLRFWTRWTKITMCVQNVSSSLQRNRSLRSHWHPHAPERLRGDVRLLQHENGRRSGQMHQKFHGRAQETNYDGVGSIIDPNIFLTSWLIQNLGIKSSDWISKLITYAFFSMEDVKLSIPLMKTFMELRIPLALIVPNLDEIHSFYTQVLNNILNTQKLIYMWGQRGNYSSRLDVPVPGTQKFT